MEYGLRIATLDNAHRNPGEFCDKKLWDMCPDAKLTALYFGTEFCQDLLPGISEAEAFCIHCKQRDLEAVLLTPLVTHRGLNRLSRLLYHLTLKDLAPTVVFNDWGVFELLRTKHPSLSKGMGRLMNRGLRDSRLVMQARGPEGENTQRGAGIRKLASSLGVSAIETDADLDPGYLGTGTEGLKRTLHLPFTFVASGRNCLEKAAATAAGKGMFTQGLKSGCPAPCRDHCRKEYRNDTQMPLWRTGNTLFQEVPLESISRHIPMADRVVFHEQPMP